MYFGLSWWLRAKEFSCQCRRQDFDPWPKKIPHTSEQRSLCATAIEPVLWSPGATTTELMCHNYCSLHVLEPGLHNRRSHCSENSAHWNQRVPPFAATREKPKKQRRPCTDPEKQINKLISFKCVLIVDEHMYVRVGGCVWIGYP